MARIKSLRSRVWEKSQGICCLCGLQMMPDDQYGIELSYTIEHLIPRSQGGTNDLDNLDGSHQWCNQFKNGSLVEELPKGYRQVLRWKIKHLLLHRVK